MAFPRIDEVFNPDSNDRRAGVVRIETRDGVFIEHGTNLRALYDAASAKVGGYCVMCVLYLVPPKDHDKPGELEQRAAQLAHHIRTTEGFDRLFEGPKSFVRRGGRKPATNRKRCELRMPGEPPVEYPSTSAAARAIGVNQPTLLRWLSGQLPWPGGGEYRVRFDRRHLNGLRGRYL